MNIDYNEENIEAIYERSKRRQVKREAITKLKDQAAQLGFTLTKRCRSCGQPINSN